MFAKLISYPIRSKVIKLGILIVVMAVAIFGILASTPVGASAPIADPCLIAGCLIGTRNNTSYTTGTPGERASNIILDVAALLVFVTASIAIIFAVFSGFNMLTSNGDSKKFEEARNGLVYAIVGLIVAVLSFGIISSIVGVLSNTQIGGNGGTGGTGGAQGPPAPVVPPPPAP